MSRGKQPTKNASADGKHRKETKEERRVRLEKQAEARDVSMLKCWSVVDRLLVTFTFSDFNAVISTLVLLMLRFVYLLLGCHL